MPLMALYGKQKQTKRMAIYNDFTKVCSTAFFHRTDWPPIVYWRTTCSLWDALQLRANPSLVWWVFAQPAGSLLWCAVTC